MLEELSNEELLTIAERCNHVLCDTFLLLQTETDSSVRPPALGAKREEALKLILSPYERLGKELVTAIRAASSVTQARGAPIKGEEAAALRQYEIPLSDASMLLKREEAADECFRVLKEWESRHSFVIDHLIEDISAIGRAQALQEIGLEEAATLAQTARVQERLPARFSSLTSALTSGFIRGTRRSHGVVDILDHVHTLGAAALHIRRLLESERPALERLAHQVPWVALNEGYRLAAIEGTHELIQNAGGMPDLGMTLTAANIRQDVLEKLPRYRWSGPLDQDCCGPCMARKGYETYAFSVDTMPSCSSECAHGFSCRHFWQITLQNVLRDK